jgi:hypothetical protein
MVEAWRDNDLHAPLYRNLEPESLYPLAFSNGVRWEFSE